MATEWNAVPLLASAGGVAFVGWAAAILIHGWSGLGADDLPTERDPILDFFLSGAQRGGRTRPQIAKMVPGTVLMGAVAAVGLFIPISYLISPEWVAYGGVSGQLSALACLLALGAWIAHVVTVYRRALREPRTKRDTAPAGRAPGTALRLTLVSPLGSKDCASALADKLTDAVDSQRKDDQERLLELVASPDGRCLVTMSTRPRTLTSERVRPIRVWTWLVIRAAGSGSEVDVGLATRLSLDLTVSRWLLPLAPVVLFTIAALAPVVGDLFAGTGVVATVLFLTAGLIRRVGRRRLAGESQMLVRAMSSVLGAQIQVAPQPGGFGIDWLFPGRRYGLWRDVSAADLAGVLPRPTSTSGDAFVRPG